MSHGDKLKAIWAHPEYLYSYSPSNRPSDLRYVFKDRSIKGIDAAYIYATTP